MAIAHLYVRQQVKGTAAEVAAIEAALAALWAAIAQASGVDEPVPVDEPAPTPLPAEPAA